MNPDTAESREGPILITEDDPLDVFLLRRAFTRADCKAPLYFVNNGPEAIDFLQGNGPFQDRSRFPFPKLLLLDLKMPLLDGLEVLEWLEGRDERQNLRVVVLSDGAEPAAMKKAYALGADSYLQKPNADDLAGLIQSLQSYLTPSAFPGRNYPLTKPCQRLQQVGRPLPRHHLTQTALQDLGSGPANTLQNV